MTERLHDTSWSTNLETPRHVDDVNLTVSQAIDAIEHTELGNHVTHGDNGHPDKCLYDELTEAVDSGDVQWEYVQQCGCGGHVTRVYVE